MKNNEHTGSETSHFSLMPLHIEHSGKWGGL